MQTASNLDKQQVNLQPVVIKNFEAYTRPVTYETYKNLPALYLEI